MAFLIPIIFLALAFLYFGPAWRAPHLSWIGVSGDPGIYMWFLAWTPFALSHGRNPFLSTYLHFPHGFNAMWNASMLGPGLVLSPVTALFGPVVSYNLLATLELALSGYCAYLVCRTLRLGRLPSLLAGLVYGFSPYLIGQASGHPNESFGYFPALVLLLLYQILVRDGGILRGVALGALAAFQLVSGEEMLANTAVVASMGVVLLGLLHRDAAMPRLRRARAALAAAAGSGVVLSAVPLAYQLLGPRRVGGYLQTPDRFVSDLWSFAIPGPLLFLHTASSVAVTQQFTGNVPENGAYIGAPLLVLLVVLGLSQWRDRLTRYFSLLAVLIALLTMGPHLHIDGHVYHVPLPWRLLRDLPLLRNALPSRVMVNGWLAIVVLVAIAMQRVLQAPGWRRLAGGAVVVVALIPLIPLFPFFTTEAALPAFYKSDVARIPRDSVILVTPWNDPVSMLWQAEAGMRYRVPSGNVYVPGPYNGPESSPLSDRLLLIENGQPAPRLTAEDRVNLLADLRRMQVTSVVLGPGPAQTPDAQLFTQLLLRAPVKTGGVLVWWSTELPQTASVSDQA